METATVKTEIVDDGQQRDRRGRVNWPKQRRDELLAEYERSGMSQAAFARRAGLRYPTFAHWVQEARRKPCAQGARTPRVVASRFAEVCIGADNPVPRATPELTVTLPGGLVARGADAAALAALVRALLVQG